MGDKTFEYVEQTAEGGWRLRNSRVSLDSIVHAFCEGETPEAIAEDFPALSLGQVYGAIAFYLQNRIEIDRHLAKQEQAWEQLRQECQNKHGPLLDRIRASRLPPGKGEEPS